MARAKRAPSLPSKNFHVALDSLLRTLYIRFMGTALVVLGVVVDLSGVESDGSRWIGNVTFALGAATVQGRWVGFDGSDMGELLDVEGDDEDLCLLIEWYAGEIEAAITDSLGDPCNDEERRERTAAMAIEAGIDEILIGRAA